MTRHTAHRDLPQATTTQCTIQRDALCHTVPFQGMPYDVSDDAAYRTKNEPHTT